MRDKRLTVAPPTRALAEKLLQQRKRAVPVEDLDCHAVRHGCKVGCTPPAAAHSEHSSEDYKRDERKVHQSCEICPSFIEQSFMEQHVSILHRSSNGGISLVPAF